MRGNARVSIRSSGSRVSETSSDLPATVAAVTVTSCPDQERVLREIAFKICKRHRAHTGADCVPELPFSLNKTVFCAA